MVKVICDFLNGCGFNGIRFNVYGDNDDIEIVTDDDKIVGFIVCDEVVDIAYDDNSGMMAGYYFDFNDPELFAKLVWVVDRIIDLKVLNNG